MDMLSRAEKARSFLIDTYRTFHRDPEPSHFEFRTHQRIREMLKAMDIPFAAPKENITIATMGHGAPVIGLRADTDALRVQENTHLPFASENSGIMHACGHDAHIAVLLCAAKLLKTCDFSGTIKLIFQPAEEGELGAQEVLKTGLVNDVNAFFAVHVWSPLESGSMHVSSGGVAASCDMFTLGIHGRGGHGATPEACTDTVVCGSAIVSALQTIASRFTSPMEPTVVTVGSFHAGTLGNIIAGEAELKGTIRAFSPENYVRIHKHFRKIIDATCTAYDCTYDLNIVEACKVVWNDSELVEIARRAAKAVSPEGASEDVPCALGDDFADYRAVAPICYMRFGIGSDQADSRHAHHSDEFRVDETHLPKNAAWLAQTALEALNTLHS